MSVILKKNAILYSKGMSKQDVILTLEKRIAKYTKEIDKRKWYYDEYVSLMEKRSECESWLSWCKENLITSEDERN